MPIDPSKIPPWMQQLNGMQLSPEQLAQLNQQFAGTYGNVNRDGFDFAPAVSYGQGDASGSGAGNNVINGYSAIPQGTTWDLKDGEDFYGGFDTSGKFEGARQPHAFDMGDATPFLFALAAGAAAMAPAAGAAGAAGGSGAGGAGMVAGDAFLPGALGAGYEGATLTGLDAYLAGGAGGAMGGAGGGNMMNGLNGADLMSDAFVSNGGYGAGGFGGTNGSYLSNLVSGSGDLGSRLMGGTGAGSAGAGGGAANAAANAAGKGNSLLGLGASLLGAASGAEGQQGESSQTKDIPSWLKPYVQKNLGYASGLLDKQMAPGAMPGYEAMRNTGMGLLSTPQMGNGFNRFFPGR